VVLLVLLLLVSLALAVALPTATAALHPKPSSAPTFSTVTCPVTPPLLSTLNFLYFSPHSPPTSLLIVFYIGFFFFFFFYLLSVPLRRCASSQPPLSP
jgi:hypothetical protein